MTAMPPPDIASIASLRARLWDAGYRPVALKTADKMPTTAKWQERARRDPPADAEDAPTTDRLNTGILCDGLRVIDLDVEAPELAHRLRALAVAMLGETLIRTRQGTGRSALIYRAADGEPGKRALAGKFDKVEVLGKGQQLHAYGPHPSGSGLNWAPEPPHMTPVTTLPAVTEVQLDAFLAACAPLIQAEMQQAKAAAGGYTGPANEAALMADITSGASFHEPVVKLAGKWALGGVPLMTARDRLLAAFDAVPDAARDERWRQRRADLERCLLDIYGKDAGAQAEQAGPQAPPAMSILHRSASPAPPLPLDVFGPFWSPSLARAAEGANAPPDYIAMPLLALASSLLGNARWVVAWAGWAEPPCLWCASVGNPSSGKSSGASPITRDVLGKIEKWAARDYPRELEDWQTVAEIADAVMKQWKKDVAKAVKAKTALPEKPPEATPPPKPIRPRVRVADVTVEKLASILEARPKGVLYVRDELAGWLMNLARYANGGSDRPFWLEAYVGGAMQVDRVKNPEPAFIPHLTVPIFGTIQPDRLADVLVGADDGLPSRFLWTWPHAQPFAEPDHTGDVEAATNALLRLSDLTMAKDQEGQSMPSYTHLAPAAREILSAFARDMQDREHAAHGLMKSTLGKARGQALRLAMVLEYLWWCGDSAGQPEPQEVSAPAMQAAAGLMEAYFLPMAARVLGDASVPEDERNARTLATWIMKTRPARVNVSDIRDGARLQGLRESDPVKAACRFLVEAHWLTEAPSSGGRGRPRGDYIVNPRVWEARQ